MMERSLPETCDDVFMSSLSPKELVSFGQSSKTHRRRVDAYMKRAFNVESLLRKYFTKLEVHWLRYLQSRTQMLISGSTALQFFERMEYPNSDLDLYVEHRHKIMIIEWLLQIGYVFKSRRETTLEEELDTTSPHPAVQSGLLVDGASGGYFGRRGFANVYNFYKYNPERKIQLITCHRSPLQVVLNFHSSCVMNVITHEKAYALYPRATFGERRSLMSSSERPRDDQARSKYVSRGWTMVECLPETEFKSRSSAFRPGQRYIGDSNCWTIPLYPKMDSLPESQIETNTWALRFNEKGKASMRFQTFACWNLRFSYLFADKHVFEYVRPALCATDEETTACLDSDILQLLRWRRTMT